MVMLEPLNTCVWWDVIGCMCLHPRYISISIEVLYYWEEPLVRTPVEAKISEALNWPIKVV